MWGIFKNFLLLNVLLIFDFANQAWFRFDGNYWTIEKIMVSLISIIFFLKITSTMYFAVDFWAILYQLISVQLVLKRMVVWLCISQCIKPLVRICAAPWLVQFCLFSSPASHCCNWALLMTVNPTAATKCDGRLCTNFMCQMWTLSVTKYLPKLLNYKKNP